jgi:ADP-heptose:LPS heptosyltransferase
VNILVYRNSSLGDFIQAIPSIYFLKKKYKEANIFYLSHLSKINPAPIDDILKNKFLVEEFIFFEENFREMANMLNLIKLLKSKKINKFYYLNRYSCFYKLVRDFFFFKLVL